MCGINRSFMRKYKQHILPHIRLLRLSNRLNRQRHIQPHHRVKEGLLPLPSPPDIHLLKRLPSRTDTTSPLSHPHLLHVYKREIQIRI